VLTIGVPHATGMHVLTVVTKDPRGSLALGHVLARRAGKDYETLVTAMPTLRRWTSIRSTGMFSGSAN
jgi:hypothetical protein